MRKTFSEIIFAGSFLLMTTDWKKRADQESLYIRGGTLIMKFTGIDGMTVGELETALQRGGKFIVFQYCISIIILTYKIPSNIYFIKAGESGVSKSLGFSLISLLFGWWGLPWGPIYTIGSLFTNLQGGKDVTAQVVAVLASRKA